MARDYIPLERTFYPAQEGERANAIWFSLAGRGELRWADLFSYWRVVVLAEGGSGKSAELENAARTLTEAGRHVFFGRLARVAQKGLPGGLELNDKKFTDWKSSGEPGWLLLDSVDEAKGERVLMGEVFRAVARDLEGAASRVHIVLSGRFTDWEAQGDLALFQRELDWQAPLTTELPENPDTLLLEAVNGESRRKRRAPRDEGNDTHEAIVVGMSPLSPEQVRAYAVARRVANVAAFLEAVDAGNLATFVRRPIDLDWLVEYWNREGKFARLETMLEANLRQRLKEPSNFRRREERFSEEDGLRALERIGAALVLGRADEIVIPDSAAVQQRSVRAIALDQVLPDWTEPRRIELLNRPVFDPASEGYARLHNDNAGEVRAYLAARWLHRLTIAGQLSRASLLRMIFAESYEVNLVKPSMRGTAAWLALWEPAVLERLLEIDPRLLMDAGDAAGLPRASREQALERWTEEAKGAINIGMPERRALARFVQPDLESKVRELWKAHRADPAARAFLLFTIETGVLAGCADLAEAVATDPDMEEDSRSYATLALLATGDDNALRRLALHVHASARTSSASIVWKVVEELYPQHLSDDQLVDIMRDTYNANTRQVERLEYVAPTLAKSLDQAERIERVLAGVLKLARTHRPDKGVQRTQENRDRLVATIEAFAERLLELSPLNEAPALAIEAAIDAKYERRYRPLPSREEDDLYARLQATPERREAALWHAAAKFPITKLGAPVDDVFTLQYLGFAPDLVLEDVPWLLHAARTRLLPKDRVLATNALLRLSAVDGKPAGDLFEELKKLAEADTAVAETMRPWTTPRIPTPDDVEHAREMKRLEKRNASARKASDAAWLRFASDVRAHPEKLRTSQTANPGSMSGALFDTYQVLSSAAHEDNRYAIGSVEPLRGILGDVAAEAARQAFIAYWRTWRPAIRAETPDVHENAMANGDRVGLVGVSIEAATVPNWVQRLAPVDAATAARYALLELNGFPEWIEALAKEHPAAVKDVLVLAVSAELAQTYTRERNILRKISGASPAIVALIAPTLVKALRRRVDLPHAALALVLDTLARPSGDPSIVVSVLGSKLLLTKDVPTQALYLAAMFRVSPASAVAALQQTLRRLVASEHPLLMQAVLPRMFGDDTTEVVTGGLTEVPTEALEEMVRLAFTHVRVDEDLEHLGVYSPTLRDDAQRARNRLLGLLVNRPGPYSFYAIGRLQREPGHLGVPMENLASMAYTRAAFDAEVSAWPPNHVYKFEKETLALPRTSRDLQEIAMGAFADLQHHLVNGDDSLDGIVAELPNEKAIQQWVRDQIELRHGRAFLIEREPHVHDEKAPDLRLSSRVTHAKSPIEIKRSTWTLGDLEEAITEQLIGRYLRNAEYRYGILLVVHQKRRAKGWKDRRGNPLTFEAVVKHLRTFAHSIAAESAFAAQVEVAVLDVSQ